MSSMEVDERGRQFDATLDVDHSGVAERRFNQKLSLSFFFTELRSPEWLLLKNRNYDHEHDKKGEFDYCCRKLLQFIALTIMNMTNYRQMEILIIIAGSFCSSWIRNISTGRERRPPAWLSSIYFLDVCNNGDKVTLVILLEIWLWSWNRGHPVTLGFSFN